ncbi:unnamed protein product, partial [Urochloa humidicola]
LPSRLFLPPAAFQISICAAFTPRAMEPRYPCSPPIEDGRRNSGHVQLGDEDRRRGIRFNDANLLVKSGGREISVNRW